MYDEWTPRMPSGPANRNRINIYEDYEMHYWTQALDCSAAELRTGVSEVGTSADAVRSWLKG